MSAAATTAGVIERIAGLDCWPGPVTVLPLAGTGRVWQVQSGRRRYVVRLPRRSEAHDLHPETLTGASIAAGHAGLGPKVHYVGRGLLVLDYVEGRHPTPDELASDAGLRRCVGLAHDIARLSPSSAFAQDRSPLSTFTRYRECLGGTRWADRVAALEPAITSAVAASGTCPRVPVHGDLHAGNLIQDGRRLWVLDWEYAGTADPLLDLASLAVNALQDTAERLVAMLPDGAELHERWAGLRLAAAIRDLLWGYVEAAAGEALPCPDYLSINEARVERELRMVNAPPGKKD